MNSIGNVAGFVSTYVIGWVAHLTHSAASALYPFALVVAVGSALILTIPSRLIDK